jgi:hypothetical protein
MMGSISRLLIVFSSLTARVDELQERLAVSDLQTSKLLQERIRLIEISNTLRAEMRTVCEAAQSRADSSTQTQGTFRYCSDEHNGV